jgi:hypothetical protein
VEDPIASVMKEIIGEPQKDPYERTTIGPRYEIRNGKEGYYVYDYKSLDVVMKNGKFFVTPKWEEIQEFSRTLKADAPIQFPRRTM